MGINIPAGAALRFQNTAPYYYKNGGEIEEGDMVLVKKENLEAEVVRMVGDNVVVEFINQRPVGGDKRGNYKLKDLKKIDD
jgi:hypothetical protein